MTPKMTQRSQRDAEIEQGRKVAARNARLDALNFLVNEKKIVMRYALDGDRHQAWLYQTGRSNGVDWHWDGTLLAECPNDSDYPTEAFIAQIALGLMAHGVAIPERPAPRAKSESAKRVLDWKKWAPA